MATYPDVIDFLRLQHLAVVSTVSPEGRPQGATVYYHLGDVESHERFSLYFLTRRRSRKFANLMEKSDVAMTIGTSQEPYTVQIEGVAQVMETGNGVEQLRELGKKLSSDPKLGMYYVGAFSAENPFGTIEGSDFAVFHVTPHWVRFMHPDENGKMEFVQLLS